MSDKNTLDVVMEMPTLNKWALLFFILAKLGSLVGFALGFGGGNIRTAGGICLALAFIFLCCSILCCAVQLGKEKDKFEIEDLERAEMKRLRNYRYLLEMEIKELERRKDQIRL